ncbi:MAG: hypothetical protein J6X70_00730 [Muribaculaceae bacterium]|nr:hypothetical protein [Muribaculaceae bacterium]
MSRNATKTRWGRAVAAALAGLVTIVMSAMIPCEVAEGDLFFVLTDNPEDPVAGATAHGNQLNTNHVGIAHYRDGALTVVEAIPASGVTVTPIDTFLTRAQNRVAVARLVDTCSVASMVERALTYMGRPYDELFMLDEQEVYCSELVWLSYVRPDGGRVFDLAPMSFHDAQGELLPYWREHYTSRGLRIPTGALGTNPSRLSASPQLKMIYIP